MHEAQPGSTGTGTTPARSFTPQRSAGAPVDDIFLTSGNLSIP